MGRIARVTHAETASRPFSNGKYRVSHIRLLAEDSGDSDTSRMCARLSIEENGGVPVSICVYR